MNYKYCENVKNEIFALVHDSIKCSIRIFISKTSKIKRIIKYFILKECVELSDQLEIVKSLVIDATAHGTLGVRNHVK